MASTAVSGLSVSHNPIRALVHSRRGGRISESRARRYGGVITALSGNERSKLPTAPLARYLQTMVYAYFAVPCKLTLQTGVKREGSSLLFLNGNPRLVGKACVC
eukprot:3981338-Pyramimonas_sp.AAC.1